MKSEHKSHPLWGVACILIGVLVMLLGAGVLPVKPSANDAPGLVIALAGGVFFVAGAMMVCPPESRYRSLGAAVLLLCFAGAGFWVAFLAPSEGFSGGLPMAPRAMNVVLARLLFGSGVLICLALSVYAVREFLRGRR